MPIRCLITATLLLLLPASSGWAAQKQVRTRAQIVQNTPRKGRDQRPRRKTQRRPRLTKRQQMRITPRLFERLAKMPPGQRRSFLQEHPRFGRLPARQRQEIQQRLHRLSQMPRPQRDRALERYRLFDRLPREKQSEARAVYQDWQRLAQHRRSNLLDEYDSLRESHPDARQERFNSREFRDKFSDEEQQILKDLSGLFPEPTDSDQP
jgi:hypothetical protein